MTKIIMRVASILCLIILLVANTPNADGFTIDFCRWSPMQILHLTYGNGNLTAQNWEVAKLSVLAWGNIAPQINLVEAKQGETPDIIFLNHGIPEQGGYGYNVLVMADGWCRSSTIVIDEAKTAGYEKQHLMQLLGHEFGHALGIGHSDKSRTVMNSQDTWVKYKIFVAGRDEFYALEQLYGHVGDGDIWGRGLNNNDY